MNDASSLGADLPSALRKHNGRPLLVAQLGLLGGRTVLLTDAPALYIHDAAGILNTERTHRFDPLDLTRDEIVFAKASSVVHGTMQVRGLGEVSFSQGEHLRAVARGLAIGPHRYAPLPISVEVSFTGGAVAVEAAATEAPSNTPLAQALREHSLNDELYAHVETDGQRMWLRRRGYALCDLPVAALQPRRSGRKVTIDADIRVAGLAASGMTLHFPEDAPAERLVRALSSRSGPVDGARVIEQVEIRGTWSGRAVAGAADAALGAAHLALHLGSEEHRFGLGDPDLCVSGDANAMVWMDGTVGPLRLSGPLVERLSASPRVREAAARTLRGHLIPCSLTDGTPIAVALHPQGVSVRGTGVGQNLPAATVERMELAGTVDSGRRLVVDHGNGRLEWVGSLDSLAALYAGLQRFPLARRFGTTPQDGQRAVVSAEGRYLLYTVLGPLVELHQMLLGHQATTGWGLDEAVHVPDDDEQLLTVATELVHGAAEAERHLERVGLRLPAFLTACDTRYLAPESERPPVALKLLEPKMIAALAPARQLAAKLARIHEPLRHALGAAGVETEADYSMAALSTLAGAMINPIFLVSGLGQAIAASNQADRLATDRSGGARRMAGQCIDRWNHMVATWLAPIGQQVLDGLFPLRWSVAKQLSAASAVERLARLDTFLRFPASDAVAHSRQRVVESLEGKIRRLGSNDAFFTI